MNTPSTTEEHLFEPRLSKSNRKNDKFHRINLIRDETLNEKNKKDFETTTVIQESTSTATTTETSTRAADLMTTRKRTTTNPSVPLDPETTSMKPKEKSFDFDAPMPENLNHTIRWFFS